MCLFNYIQPLDFVLLLHDLHLVGSSCSDPWLMGSQSCCYRCLCCMFFSKHCMPPVLLSSFVFTFWLFYPRCCLISSVVFITSLVTFFLLFLIVFRPCVWGLNLGWNNKLLSPGTPIFRFYFVDLIALVHEYLCIPFCLAFLALKVYLLQGYFNNLSEYLRVGPPLYFVVKDYNYR